MSITLKSPAEIEKMRIAGRLAADLFSGAIGMYWIARLLAPDAVTRRWTHRLPVGPPGRTATPEQTADTRASAA